MSHQNINIDPHILTRAQLWFLRSPCQYLLSHGHVSLDLKKITNLPQTHQIQKPMSQKKIKKILKKKPNWASGSRPPFRLLGSHHRHNFLGNPFLGFLYREWGLRGESRKAHIFLFSPKSTKKKGKKDQPWIGGNFLAKKTKCSLDDKFNRIYATEIHYLAD